MIDFLYGLYVKLVYIKHSLKQIHKPKLIEEVTYGNQRCIIINGTCAPYWTLSLNHKHELVHRDNFKLDRTPKRYWYSFTYTYEFHMKHWYKIQLNRKGSIILF